LYVIINDQKAAIIVTDDGVSVDFLVSEQTIHTNIVPKRIFGEREDLNWKRLRYIIHLLENTNLEGRLYSRAEMKKSFQTWKDLGKL
jgi:hypothetical protein